MDLDLRSSLRVVLVAAGVGYVLWGAIDGRTTLVLVGLLAVVVGFAGIWREGLGRTTGE